jgi:hypothetical protein
VKRSLLLVLVLCALALSSSVLTAGKAHTSKRQEAVVEFPDQVKLLNVVLKGQYLIVHDDELMARGENCTLVYSLNDGQRKLVASFHCIPVERARVASFAFRTNRVSPDAMEEVREFQFGGSREGHQVPSK